MLKTTETTVSTVNNFRCLFDRSGMTPPELREEKMTPKTTEEK
jgi:hypothetical protein